MKQPAATLTLALVAASLWGAEPPLLLRSRGGVTLFSDDRRVELTVPDGVELEAVWQLDHGVVLSGVRRTATGEQPILVEHRTQGEVERALPSSGRTARAPAAMVSGGRLVGAAWLEGDDARRLAVRVATWSSAGWSEPVTLSPSGPGSQLGLVGAALPDGTWLLAWSAFDGNDDEILWTTGSVEAGFATPRALTANDVPDITPAVTTIKNRPLIAWSGYDGNDYRLHVAGFADGGWLTPLTFAGRGAFSPSWHPADDGHALLLARDTEAEGWRLLELDSSGVALRQAVAAGTPDRRPVPASPIAGGVRLHWEDGRLSDALWTDVEH